MGLSIVFQLAMPVVMAISGIAVWRATKNRDKRDPARPEWNDTSLDDWRKQRDAEAIAERQARAAAPQATRTGSENEDEPVRHQRIGG